MDTANIRLDESLAAMMFGSADARELLLRKILFRLSEAAEAVALRGDTSKQAQQELGVALGLAGVFWSLTFPRASMEEIAFLVDRDELDRLGVAARITQIREPAELK